MERQAYVRALEFLQYSRVAKWASLIASILTGLVFVSLLILLGLFADLVINRGDLPCLSQLPLAEQIEFRQHAEAQPASHWVELSKKNGADVPARLDTLVRSERPEKLTTADAELRRSYLWMLEAIQLVAERVGPDAEDKVRSDLREQIARFGAEQALNRSLDNLGVLSLVVRTSGGPGRWVAEPMARMGEWTWHHGNTTYLAGLLVWALVLAFLRGFFYFLNQRMAARATVEAITRMRRAIYLHTYRLGALAFRSLGPSEAVSVSTRHLEAVHDALFAWLTVYFREPVKFALLLSLALLIHFWLALAFLLFAALVWLVGGQASAFFRRQVRVAEHRAAEQLALIQESLMLMRLVKIYLMERFNLGRFEKQLSAYAEAEEHHYRSEAVYRPLFVTLAMVAALALLFLAGNVVLSGYLGVAGALTLATALVCLYWPAVNWLEARRIVRRGRDSATVLFQFLDRPGSVAQAAEAEFLPPLSRSIEIDNVSLKELGSNRRLLRGVTLGIRAGQKTAIVGPDDTEKYALVYLLSRFLDPSSGEIRVDKKNIRWVTLDSLRAQMAMVMQHSLVFNDTVANNIGCGDTAYNMARITEAAKIAHAHQFIQKLPKGYDTLIGELGHPLKVGEMFRIALARAILRDPALLIIEEPHAPLDDDTKAMLDDTFQRILPGRTTLFLPHRLSTIKTCDRVFLLHEGRIVEQGLHRELLQSSDLYRHLQYLEFNEFAGIASPPSPDSR